MARKAQYEPYSGPPLIPQMPDAESNDYLQVVVYDNTRECSNQDLWMLWDDVNQGAERIANDSAAAQPLMTEDLMRIVLKEIDDINSEISVRMASRTADLFDAPFGNPPLYRFERYPIRWPGENRFALTAVMGFVSAAHQIPNLRSRTLDHGVLQNHAIIIAKPLINLKSAIMRQWFLVEPQGAISPDELQALFRNAKHMHPVIQSSLDDRSDSAANIVTEDGTALTDESTHLPTAEALAGAELGQPVCMWVPTNADWTAFGERLRRLEDDGPIQVPPEPFPFDTAVIHNGTAAGGTTPTGALTEPR